MMSGTHFQRRRFLRLLGGTVGLSLLNHKILSASTARQPIRACIVIFYYGGPSHIDTFDPKPDAPAEVRGEFRPIATSVPGTRIGEHLPQLARIAHKYAIVRSMTHGARLHDSASIHALTGRALDGPDRELFAPTPQFYPSYGSMVAKKRPRGIAPFVSLPFIFRNVHPVPCQGAGILGSRFEPLHVNWSSGSSEYQIESMAREPAKPSTRSDERKSLLNALDPARQSTNHQELYERAFALLESNTLTTALDLSQEPIKVRERYGTSPKTAFASEMRGQNLLVARRLVEADVPFVTVYDFQQQGQNWDSHANNFQQLRDHLLPPVDRSLSALIEDLEARGLLDSTLVLAFGEFGRTPRINQSAGRDHWPDCYSMLLAGGGITGGIVHGSSDKIGAYPSMDPVTPADLASTILWRFGIDPQFEIMDQLARPHVASTGKPLTPLFAH